MNRIIKFRGFWLDTKKPVKDILDYGLDILNDPQIAIQQFTGLLDKNGREIYEGDIIKINSNYETEEPIESLGKVFFKDGYFMTDFHDASIRIALKGNWLVEVIGNIFENPELVK